MRLTEVQLEDCRTNGFVHIPAFMDASDVVTLLQAVEALRTELRPSLVCVRALFVLCVCVCLCCVCVCLCCVCVVKVCFADTHFKFVPHIKNEN